MPSILGFSTTSDSGASILREDNIENAVNEERLNRIKLYSGFPHLSIDKLKELSPKSEDNKQVIAFSSHRSGMPEIPKYVNRLTLQHFSSAPKLLTRGIYIFHERNSNYTNMRKIAEKKFGTSDVRSYDHHFTHAASAFFTSGLKNALAVTEDGWGDAYSNGAYSCNGNSIEMLHASSELDSIGYLYGRITVALGFRFHRHEGKITGLAGYGKPDPDLVQKFKRMVWFNPGRMCFESKIGGGYAPFGNHFLAGLRAIVKPYKREVVAASIQKWVEDINRAYFTALIEEHGSHDIVLSGGVFANVALNRVVKETPGVKSVYIFPHMGDGGLGLGAALLAHNEEFGSYNKKFSNLYLGPSYTDSEIKSALKKQNLEFEKVHDIEHQIAELIAKGKVIGRFNGAMEYGPRALGNRSILYQPTDKSVNDWLNKQLSRTEFMPFAPSTLAEYAHKCYNNMEGAEYAAQFMTITFDCTESMSESSPAVVHLDNTARPQIVHKEANPSYYKIIDEYRKITGIPSIVNTSFNVHEEPIVCNPDDAITAYRQSRLDFLAIGNYLVKQ